MTFDEYQAAVIATKDAHPEWRTGQAAFNVLCQYRPDLSERIRATPLDPFHEREDLSKFYAWVKWNCINPQDAAYSWDYARWKGQGMKLEQGLDWD